MPPLSLLLLVASGLLAARDDDPPVALPPPAPIRTQLDAARGLVGRERAERDREYERINAESIPQAAQEERRGAAAARFHAAITPSCDALLAAVDAHPTDPAAIEALRFILVDARGLATGQLDRAIRLLNRDHATQPGVTLATGVLFLHTDKPEALALLQAVATENTSRTERGRAAYDLAFALRSQLRRVERRLRTTPAEPLPADLAHVDPGALRARTVAAYELALAQYSDVATIEYPDVPESLGKTVGAYARGDLAELQHLQVGQPAPEISGQDIDGKTLRLSDHRGRVVVLDFAGEWCGPCREAAKFLRKLVEFEVQKATPCIILEVNTDRTRDPLRQAIARGEVRWPCWFDGGTDGPITMAWGVNSFPTLYVIDPDGIIRAKDIRGEAVAAAVADVLAKYPPPLRH